jgi:DNA-binding transcriptional LysR family regulator
MDRSSSNFVFLDNQARLAGKTLNARVHVQDFNSVLYLVEAQVGVALVPASVAEKHIHEKKICGIAIDEAWSVRNLHLIIKHESADIDLVRDFADILLHDPQLVAARHKGS